MKVPLAEARDLCVRILTQEGLAREEAAIITEDYLDAEMRGKTSHGLAAFRVAQRDAGERGHGAIASQEGPHLLWEGNGDIGHILGAKALDFAAEACKVHGFGIVGLRNIRRIATPGSLARKAAQKRLIGIVLEYGGYPFVAPHGSTEGVLSSNPLGIGIPTSDGPVVLDMATTERAGSLIILARLLGKDLPAGIGLDGEGRPTTDPHEATTFLPFGGYKGSALAFMMEILTGPFLGVDVGKSGKPASRGALLLFFAPTLFGVSFDEFSTRVRQLISEVKSARLAPGHAEIFTPGEQGERRRKACEEAGTIDLEPAVWEKLQGMLRG